jgi:hydroxymethylbilane synthase
VPISTLGDRDRRRTFADIGGRGVFVREIEHALLDGTVDTAVHSAKDLTDEEHPDLVFAACLERGDPRDAWCGPARAVADVAPGARVGTSSLRRTAQLRRLRPDLLVEPIRGNVETRLRKRSERGLDAVLLAACGLDRLDLQHEIGFRLAVETMIPESGQGVIVVQTRRGDEHLVEALDHPPSRLALLAERACTRILAGGCTVPVAAHARLLPDGRWRLQGFVGRIDGSEALTEAADGDDPLALGAAVAGRLLERGGAALLEAVRA